MLKAPKLSENPTVGEIKALGDYIFRTSQRDELKRELNSLIETYYRPPDIIKLVDHKWMETGAETNEIAVKDLIKFLSDMYNEKPSYIKSLLTRRKIKLIGYKDRAEARSKWKRYLDLKKKYKKT